MSSFPRRAGTPAVRQPAFNVPPVTLWATLALVAVYAGLMVAPAAIGAAVLNYLVVVPLRFALILQQPFGLDTLAVLATLLTHALVHVEALHLVMNAGFLLAFGSLCERALGPRRFLLLLVLSAIGGGVAQVAADWGDAVVMFGASGAVSGCVGAFCRLLLARRDGPARGRRMALNLIGLTILVNLVFAVFGGGLFGIDAEIAWQAHIGGFVVGLLLGVPPARASAR